MFRYFLALALMLVMFISPMATMPASAEEVTLQKFYIVPVEQVGSARGPEYFVWRFDANPPSIDAIWSMMDYGFMPYGLVYVADITQPDHDALILHADVYSFPDNLDAPITDPNIDLFFEAISIPSDWLTPSTTYRELLRYTAGMFQFNQAYAGISASATGQIHSIFDNGRTLESNWNSLSATEKAWFNAAIQQMQPGAPSVNGNPKLRSLAKQAGDLWGARPFYLGGFEF